MEEENLIRQCIAKELAKKMAEGIRVIDTQTLATFKGKEINPESYVRYIPRAPLFTYRGKIDQYPVFHFIWANEGMFNLRPAIDWLDVLKASFTYEVMDRWMQLSVQKTKVGKQDHKIFELAAARFWSVMKGLKHPGCQLSTEEKIETINREIKTFWNVAYGHK